MDVYAAREDPVPGVTGALVADAVALPPGRGRASSRRGRRSPPARRRRARPGDLVLTVGAGDVTMLGPEILRGAPGRRAAMRRDAASRSPRPAPESLSARAGEPGGRAAPRAGAAPWRSPRSGRRAVAGLGRRDWLAAVAAVHASPSRGRRDCTAGAQARGGRASHRRAAARSPVGAVAPARRVAGPGRAGSRVDSRLAEPAGRSSVAERRRRWRPCRRRRRRPRWSARRRPGVRVRHRRRRPPPATARRSAFRAHVGATSAPPRPHCRCRRRCRRCCAPRSAGCARDSPDAVSSSWRTADGRLGERADSADKAAVLAVADALAGAGLRREHAVRRRHPLTAASDAGVRTVARDRCAHARLVDARRPTRPADVPSCDPVRCDR